MPKLVANTVAVSRITTDQRREMWSIFEVDYSNVSWERFNADLDEKDHVILLVDDGRIRGFSTLVVDRFRSNGRDVVSIFTGDTVIAASHRRQTVLPRAFFRYLVTQKLKNPRSLVVWFLISKGYKTYLLLTRNMPTVYPRRGQPTPPWVEELLRELAIRRFGPEPLDPEALVLRFGDDAERLRENAVPVEGETDPDILFFVEKNPGHTRGEELCCVGVVNAQLLWFFPRKILLSAFRSRR